MNYLDIARQRAAARSAARVLGDGRNELDEISPDAIHTAPPYRCWATGCTASVAGPWQRIGPDCWQTACSTGHPIQRSAASFDEPPSDERGRTVALPTREHMAGTAPLELWVYDRLHPTPGTPPWPAPASLTGEQIATEVDAARRPAQPLRFKPKPSPVRDPALVARILAAGERLGWPALALRPGERLAAGEACWRTFVLAAPADRLHDAKCVTGEMEATV